MKSLVVKSQSKADFRNGLLADITVALNDAKAKIVSINARTTQNRVAIISVGIEVEDTDKLNKALKAVRKVDSVYEVQRSKQ